MTRQLPKQRSKERMIICICGMVGSGKTTVAKKIAKHYGLRYYSGGDALKAVAADMGYETTAKGWWETKEGLRFLGERLDNLGIDKKVDDKMLEWAGEGGVVLDSWAIPWLLKEGFKVWLEASEEVRVKRLAERDRLDIKEAVMFLKEKESRTREIYRNLYGFDLGVDFSPFHLILDVNQLSRNEVFQALRMTVDNLVLGGEDPSASNHGLC